MGLERDPSRFLKGVIALLVAPSIRTLEWWLSAINRNMSSSSRSLLCRRVCVGVSVQVAISHAEGSSRVVPGEVIATVFCWCFCCGCEVDTWCCAAANVVMETTVVSPSRVALVTGQHWRWRGRQTWMPLYVMDWPLPLCRDDSNRSLIGMCALYTSIKCTMFVCLLAERLI